MAATNYDSYADGFGTTFAGRLARWVWTSGRPLLGWPAFIVLLALAAMPAAALLSTEWVALPGYGKGLTLAGPLGIVAAWLLIGWKKERFDSVLLRWQGWLLFLIYTSLGLAVVLQLVAGWLPGPSVWWTSVISNNWLGPLEVAASELARIWTRIGLWRQGVIAGGAAQDNLVVALLFGFSFWMLAGWSAFLARRTRKGLIIALPILWIVLLQLAYSTISRGVFVYALLLAILLHLILDQERMLLRWKRLGLDYNPGIGMERVLIASIAVAVVMGVAAIFPNVYVPSVAQAYYDYMVPINEQVDGSVERVLPEAQGMASSMRRRGGMGGGLPNDFLLQGGPDLRQIEVLRYRTNEPWFMDFPFDEIGPGGHYMRGGTYANYNGRGWGNTGGMERVAYGAEERQFAEMPYGRRELVQSIVLAGPTQLLYAAPEIIEASVDYRLEVRGDGDVVAAWSRERSYTVVSATPAVSESELRAFGNVNSFGLDASVFAHHLALPDSVTERTRQLAEEVTAGYDTAYDKAAALEIFLRTYEYDLTVSMPPGSVRDIADYFLFDLQRGYCDYYATAFVVMARAVGLPARFATGFSAGYWNPADTSHVVSEADAHSWPEVYFPDVGWIPFEPTAAQPLILRVGTTTLTSSAGGAVPVEAPAIPAQASTRSLDLNWQIYLWLIPLAGVLYLAYRGWSAHVARAAEPWGELLNWGRRLGRPIEPSETPLEYGRNLGEYVIDRVKTNHDTGRLVAREMGDLGTDISNARYGPASDKESADARAAARWQRLRGYRGAIRT